MSNKFIIRGYFWGYNDETYYPAGSYIHSVFDDEASAVAKHQSLEREHWQQINLGETDVFFDAHNKEKLCKKVNDFVMEKYGKTVFDDCDDTYDTYFPKELSGEDLITVLNMTGLHAYKLVRFDTNPKFYAVWLPEKEEYLQIHDECSTALLYEKTREELENEAAEWLEYEWDEEVKKLKGDLGAISENPTA